jgi:hypothetical protein
MDSFESYCLDQTLHSLTVNGLQIMTFLVFVNNRILEITQHSSFPASTLPYRQAKNEPQRRYLCLRKLFRQNPRL